MLKKLSVHHGIYPGAWQNAGGGGVLAHFWRK